MAPLIALLVFRSDAGRSDTSSRAFFRSNGLHSLSSFTVEFEFEVSCWWGFVAMIDGSFGCCDCDCDDDGNAANGCDNGNDVICCCCFGDDDEDCNCCVSSALEDRFRL